MASSFTSRRRERVFQSCSSMNFGGNHESWEPQMRFFARRYRCISYAARGYAPSDIPSSVESYSQEIAVTDAVAVLDALGIEKAHIAGLSMGGFATVHFGLMAPERALSLTVAGAGYGSEKEFEDYFKHVSLEVADNFESKGAREFSKIYALGASRVQFQNKDPRGWREFAARLATHSDAGAANTMRGVQARRPSLYDLEDRLKVMNVPTLVIAGDEDDHCLQPGIFLKKTIPAAAVFQSFPRPAIRSISRNRRCSITCSPSSSPKSRQAGGCRAILGRYRARSCARPSSRQTGGGRSRCRT